MKFRTLAILLGVTLVFTACSSDELPPPYVPTFCETQMVTYDNQIAPIIASSCGYVGCHDGSNAPGNYDSYAGLQGIINDGKFKSRVIDVREDPEMGMPPDYATDGPMDLTDEQIELIQCWINDGYPEN